jgi:4-amino-4-deoxy-L-arabinose transferase-like glycosyltransferase
LALSTIVLAALVGRLVYVAAVTRHPPLTIDELYYVIAGDRFARGHGFTAPGVLWPAGSQLGEHPPLTSLVLSPFVRFTDISSDVPRYAMATFGAALVVVVALVANEVAGRRVALIAAVLAAVYPNLWVNDGLLMSETLAALTTALTMIFTLRLRSTPTIVVVALAGGSSGLAALSRSELILLLPLLVAPAVLLLHGIAARRRIWLLATATLACGLIVAPWIIYNLNRFDEPVLLSMDGGTLLGANCDSTYSGPLLGSWNGYCTLPPPAVGDLSVRRAAMRDAAFEYMGDHAGQLPKVMLARMGRTWGLFRPFQPVSSLEFDGRPPWISLAGIWSHWLLLAGGFAGAVIIIRQTYHLVVLASPAVIVTIASALAYGRERFRVPAEMSLVVLTAVAVDAFARYGQFARLRYVRSRVDPTAD